MEEEEKVPPTSEPNPNEENNEVDESDLEDENHDKKNDPKEGDGGDDSGDGSDKSEEEGKKPNAKKQSREEDAKYAEERRKRKEREEAARKKHDDEIREKTLFEYKSSQVTQEELKELNLAKVENSDQLYLVETLRKAKADGVENPVAYAYQSYYKKESDAKVAKKAEEDAAQEAQKKRLASVAEDQKNFFKKFGKKTSDVVKNEPEFMKLFGTLIDEDKGNFTELYTAYSEMKKDISDEAKRQGEFFKGDGSGNNQGNNQGNKPRTREEFDKYWDEKYHS